MESSDEDRTLLSKDENRGSKQNTGIPFLPITFPAFPWRPESSYNKQKYPAIFTKLNLFYVVIYILFFYNDIAADLFIVKEYYRLNRLAAFGFSAFFVAFPLLVIMIMNLSWYRRDYAKQRELGQAESKLLWIFRIFFTFPLMSGQVVRKIEYAYHGWKSRSLSTSRKHISYHYHQMLSEDADVDMLSMFEAFLEAAPQLVLQLYFILTESTIDGKLMYFARALSLFYNCINLGRAVVNYQNSARLKRSEQLQSTTAFCLNFLWRTFEIGPRILIFAVFAAEFGYKMLLVVLVPRWVCLTLWVAYNEDRNVHRTYSQKLVFDSALAYMLMFCLQNVQESNQRIKAFVYYSITFTENIAMLLACVYFGTDNLYYIPIYFAIPVSMLLHLTLQRLYYQNYSSVHDHVISFLNHRKSL